MAISKASTSSLSTYLSKSKSLKTDPVLPVQTGLIMWYDASNTASLTISGSSVTRWADLSGNGRHATTGIAAPQYVANALNAKGAVYFGTDSQYNLVIANPITFASKNCHFFAVVKSNKESTTNYSGILGTYLQPTSGGFSWTFPGGTGTGGTQQFLIPGIAWASAANKGDYLNTTFYNINASLVAGTAVYRASRADDGGGTQTGTVTLPTNALGWQEDFSYGGNVTIAELICFGYKLSDSDRDKVENYLFDKWGV
jgi:hypothetical protein